MVDTENINRRNHRNNRNHRTDRNHVFIVDIFSILGKTLNLIVVVIVSFH